MRDWRCRECGGLVVRLRAVNTGVTIEDWRRCLQCGWTYLHLLPHPDPWRRGEVVIDA